MLFHVMFHSFIGP